jgi:DeoR/GlpR family transcriptional regulator of sugar metabolism
MSKKTVAQRILNLLNTHGGLKPKGIINLSKANPATVYTTLNKLRSEKKIAKEEDGVYISQTQTSTTPEANPTALKDNLVKRVQELAESNGKLTSRVADLEAENARLRHLYMDKNAVVRYLEAKIEEFWEA